MAVQMANSALEKTLNMTELQRLLDAYALAHKVFTGLFDAKGNLLVASEVCGMSALCARVQESKAGQRMCQRCVADAGHQAALIGEPYVFRCGLGLVSWAAPVLAEEEYAGSIVAGQIIMWELDEIARTELITRARKYQLDPDVLLRAASSLSQRSGPEVQAAADLLFVLATHVADRGLLILSRRRELSRQQALLAETIFEEKREAKKSAGGSTGNHVYPLEKEKELLGRVRLGDRAGAKEILNQLLGGILVNSAGKTEVLKARILELSVMLSRAAVEGGASLERLLGLNFHYVEELAGIEAMEDICAWIVRVLDTFMDEVYATRETKISLAIAQAVDYIRNNFADDLTLERVAQAVHLSPYYLSHLFKEELGISFIEYVTKVRIEEAKKLLLGTSATISEIACMVGYQDSSYFTKVFKKLEGQTPTQFRK